MLWKAMPAASRCAEALRARWPMIRAVWLFGSAIEGPFTIHSDIDLAVETHAGGLPVDLVRIESPLCLCGWMPVPCVCRTSTRATPDGADWHRRAALQPACGAISTPTTWIAEQVQRLLGHALTLWPEVTADLDAFTAWLGELRGAC